MDNELIQTVGQIAGVGGIALGVFLLLFKDLLKKLKIPGLQQKQWFIVVLVFMILTWSIAVIGLITWYFSTPPDVTKGNNNTAVYIFEENVMPSNDAKTKFKARIEFTSSNFFLDKGRRPPDSLFDFDISENEKRITVLFENKSDTVDENIQLEIDFGEYKIHSLAIDNNSRIKLIGGGNVGDKWVSMVISELLPLESRYMQIITNIDAKHSVLMRSKGMGKIEKHKYVMISINKNVQKKLHKHLEQDKIN